MRAVAGLDQQRLNRQVPTLTKTRNAWSFIFAEPALAICNIKQDWMEAEPLIFDRTHTLYFDSAQI